MSKIIEAAGALVDSGADLIEKVASPASRAGSTVERAGRLLEEGVDAEVIALQMTKNSPNGTRYTEAKVLAFGELYEDSKTKAPLTAAQTRALIKDQRAQQSTDTPPLPV
ncbi:MULTISPECIES: hypothetical protein [Pseudomonadota]|uniref:Uncharacterized protein n=1 Tax=Alcaligenes faecalis TaxID=511 RepID=A0AAE9H4T8_ALCFA|nr:MULTISPECIES: hypothetical protein [Pseudomonadota]UPL19883.1 hypothetical protein MXF72_10600 [Alcaligenes faecalis]HCI5733939.1 hypothetical protein [Klebsiella variicola subsp. variicola]